MSRCRSYKRWAILVLLLMVITPLFSTGTVARTFEATDKAEAILQSRYFEDADPADILRASLAVIQDLKFHVTESALEPGLLVAVDGDSPYARSARTLTISLREVPGRERRIRVRLSIIASVPGQPFEQVQQPDYTDFYQEFFDHLNQSLFRRRQLP
jgi:hypothetical protein